MTFAEPAAGVTWADVLAMYDRLGREYAGVTWVDAVAMYDKSRCEYAPREPLTVISGQVMRRTDAGWVPVPVAHPAGFSVTDRRSR